jgi:glycosyltransferase involved in cell wall biosynthesis
MQKVVIIGPAHPLRGGGITTFNQRLAKEFLNTGFDCSIVSFSLQYPSVFFPGTSQYTTDPSPEGIIIHSLINSVNPINWLQVGKKIKSWRPDLVVVRYWLPFMAPALGTILRQIKKNKHSRIICIADNIVPHEKNFFDTILTKYFIKACDGFITMSQKVFDDLQKLQHKKPVKLIRHPLYDNFGKAVNKKEAREHLGLNTNDKIILFFGFIRKYKGLDLLLEAMNNKDIRKQNIRLLVAGEFYDDKKAYEDIIQRHTLQKLIILKSNFIQESEVRYYLSACDCIVQPYREATQSGVTPLAYHFEKPMIVTNVGGLPSMVIQEKTGLICAPESSSITAAILKFYEIGEENFLPYIRTEKEKFSWANLTSAILQLSTNQGDVRQ